METTTTNQQSIISYLTFIIGGEHFGINVGKVINVLEYIKITKVPKSPEYISGIINLRGEVLPVIDTNIKLGLGETKINSSTCILVIETQFNGSDIKFGALIDAVQEVLEFENNEILAAPNIGVNNQADYIAGIVKYEDELIMFIDVNKLFTSSEIHEMIDSTKMATGRKQKNVSK